MQSRIAPFILTIGVLMNFAGSTSLETFQGDEEYLRFDYSGAETLYLNQLSIDLSKSGAYWRLSRLFISIADVSPAKDREGFYRTAERYARKCIMTNVENADGHTWLAASLGNIAMYEGGETKVQLSREIHRELLRALELNPNDDVAYSILGSFYRALGGISWIERQLANLLLGGVPDGGYPEAETALKKAITLAPQVMRHQYEIGMLYRDWDRIDEAKEVLRKAASLSPSVKSDSTRIQEIQRFFEEEDQ